MNLVSLPALVGAALLLVLPPGPVSGDVSARELAGRLEERLRQAGIPEAELGLAVLTLEHPPRLVFARGQSQSLMPASVAKVLTAATALDLLGPSHRFTTRVTARGTVADGALVGDLVVHGSGDPNLSGRLQRAVPTTELDALAAGVLAQGVRRVTGDLVLDDGPFDREFVHPGWTDADRDKWYGAPVGGLAFNDSCLDVTVRPAPASASAALLEFPSTSGAWEVRNLTLTVAGSRHVVGATWSAAGPTLEVRGQVALSGAPYTFQVPVPDPVGYFGGAFRQRLEQAGVRVEGAVRLARRAEDRAAGRLLAAHESPMGPTLEVMNRRSQNFYASVVFKAAGAAQTGLGTWASGQAAVDEMLRRRGLGDEGRTQIVDGSGLARANRTTAGTVALLLLSFERDLLRGPLLHASLAAPGEVGTLDDRLLSRHTKGRLRAKTGTLAQAGAHALAGYLDAKGGQPGLAFAILVNKRTWKGDPRALIDDVVALLASP